MWLYWSWKRRMCWVMTIVECCLLMMYWLGKARNLLMIHSCDWGGIYSTYMFVHIQQYAYIRVRIHPPNRASWRPSSAHLLSHTHTQTHSHRHRNLMISGSRARVAPTHNTTTTNGDATKPTYRDMMSSVRVCSWQTNVGTMQNLRTWWLQYFKTRCSQTDTAPTEFAYP